jgi:hypothetical protein
LISFVIFHHNPHNIAGIEATMHTLLQDIPIKAYTYYPLPLEYWSKDMLKLASMERP